MAQLKTENSKIKNIIRRLLEYLILVFGLLLLLILADRILPQIAIKQIAQLTNTKIKTDSIDFSFKGYVSIEKLVIGPKKPRKYDDAILKAETVKARFAVLSILMLKPRLKQITVNDFVFDAKYDLDTAKWNIASLKLKPPKGGPEKMPLITLNRGKLRYSKVSNADIKVATEIPIDAALGPPQQQKEKDWYKFSITTATMAGGYGKSELRGLWKPGMITFAGGISSKDVPTFERTWDINIMASELKYEKNNDYYLKLIIKNMHSTPSTTSDKFTLVRPAFLQESTPFAALQGFLKRFRPEGIIDIDIHAFGNLNQLHKSKLIGKLYCRDVSICDIRFPYKINKLIGQVDFTENNAVLKNLAGKHGDAKITIHGSTSDFGPNSKYQIQIKSDNMPLDKDIYEALSARKKKSWSAFSPGGHAAIDYRLARKSKTQKTRTLDVELREAQARYTGFPYQLKNITGKLSFRQDRIIVSNLVSKYNGRKITLNGQVEEHNSERPIYNLLVTANDIPLDSQLAEALPPEQKSLYQQLDMNGLADIKVNIFTNKQNLSPTSVALDVSFKEVSLRPQQFPILISDISAKAAIAPNSIKIEKFTGQLSQGSVSLFGRILPAGKAKQQRYELALHAEKVQLNEDLIDALPQPLKKIVKDIQPSGEINLTADLSKADTNDSSDYKLIVQCLGNSATLKQFPYPLKDVTGTLIITTDSIKLDNISASVADNIHIAPNASTIKLNGQINLRNKAFDTGSFRISANDVLFDQRLAFALPERVRQLYLALSPTGSFDLNLNYLKMLKTDDGDNYIDFTGSAKVKPAYFKISGATIQLDAVLKTQGLYITGDGFYNGNVNISADTMRINGKTLTDFKADIIYDPLNRIWSSENIFADCYTGKVIGKCDFKKSEIAPMQYSLQVGFKNIDLKQFLSDNVGNSRPKGHTTGKMSGSINLNAAVGQNHSRIGVCTLTATDMQVGKPSPLARLLAVLSLTETKDFIFETMLVDSYIKDDRMSFKKFDLSGKSLAFTGSGYLDLITHNIDLILTARGQRLATAKPSILESLTEGIGAAVVRMEVTGPYYDPKVETKPLPILTDPLRILGSKPDEQNH